MSLLLLLNSQVPAPADVTLTLAEPDGPIDAGDMVRRVVAFTDPVTGVLVDPGGVTATVRDPYGTSTAASVTRVSAGTYRLDVTASMPGTWSYRFVGTPPYSGVLERRFTVQSSAF